MKPGGPLLAFAAFGAYWGVWAVVVPDVKERTGASVTEFGVALFAVAAAALPAMLLTGRWIDRRGPGIVAPALVGYGFAAVLPGLVDSVVALALALALIGALSGVLDVGINVAASTVEATGGPRIMQAAHALFSGGFLVAAVASGLARTAGVEPAWLLLASGLLFVVAAWFNRGYPKVTRPRELPASTSRGSSSPSAPCARSPSWSREGSRAGARSSSRPSTTRRPPSAASARRSSRPRWSRAARSASALEGRIGGRRLLVGGGLVAAVWARADRGVARGAACAPRPSARRRRSLDRGADGPRRGRA